MLKEFRDFAVKGNALDLAVGVIIGAAFGKIVSSLVEDIIMPPLGMILGRVDFTNFYISLSGNHYPTLAEAKKAGEATINYGVFLTNTLNFLIVAFAVFMLVRQINKLKKAPVAAPATNRPCPRCFTEIPKKATRCSACTSEVAAVE